MSFVKGKFCHGCNAFVVESVKKHVCPQKYTQLVQKPGNTGTIQNILPAASTSTVKKILPGASTSSVKKILPGASTSSVKKILPGASTSSVKKILPGASTSSVKKILPGASTSSVKKILPGASTSSVKDILPDSPPMTLSSWFHSLSDHDEESHDEESPPKDIRKVQSTSNTDQKIVGVSKEDMTGLITSIEVCRPLWYHKMSLGERSENIKNNLWNKIFTEFDGKYSIQGLKKSWKYLKERYTREKKSGVSGAAGGKQEWCYLSILRFLDEVLIVDKCTVDNLTPTHTSLENDSNQKQDRKSVKRSVMESQMGMIMEELKQSRPIPPLEPVLIEPESNDDTKFSSYLASLMSDLPKKKKRILQGQLIAIVIEQIDN